MIRRFGNGNRVHRRSTRDILVGYQDEQPVWEFGCGPDDAPADSCPQIGWYRGKLGDLVERCDDVALVSRAYSVYGLSRGCRSR